MNSQRGRTPIPSNLGEAASESSAGFLSEHYLVVPHVCGASTHQASQTTGCDSDVHRGHFAEFPALRAVVVDEGLQLAANILDPLSALQLTLKRSDDVLIHVTFPSPLLIEAAVRQCASNYPLEKPLRVRAENESAGTGPQLHRQEPI
jgi:hypothetical protein